jgi:hypothetical protein
MNKKQITPTAIIVFIVGLWLLVVIFTLKESEVISQDTTVTTVPTTSTTLNVEKFEELAAIPTTTKAKAQETTPTTQPFSHENCQYPGRYSNPVGGCDNTDPANPECIDEMYSKQAEQECIERLNNEAR